MDTLVAFVVAVLVIGFFMRSYLNRQKNNEEEARAAAEKGKLYPSGPQSQHPHIYATYCIACAASTTVSPEADLPASRDGKALTATAYKSICPPLYPPLS